MRYVEVTVPTGRKGAVLEILEDEGINYVVSDETSGRDYVAVVRFPIPSQAVEQVLDRLTEAGISDDASIVVIDAETILSDDFARLKEQYSRGRPAGGRISRHELQTRAADLTPSFAVYATMTFISAIVATSGLLLDSPAVVVGSMVIAPLIGPALAASIGTVIADSELRSIGLAYQFSGLGIAVLGSILFAGLVRVIGLEPAGIDIVAIAELEERVAPNLLALVIALGAGVAGILSLTRELSEAIVGVMIAAALIPPAAAVGIALAWGIYGAAGGALILTLVNALSINFAALVTLWGGGYRPPGLFTVSTARRQTVVFAAVIGLIILLLLLPLVSATIVELRAAQLESDVEAGVDGVLADPEYDRLEAETVAVELDAEYPIRSIDRVVITITGPETDLDSALTARLATAIEPHVDDSIELEVQFLTSHGETLDPREQPVESSPSDPALESNSPSSLASLAAPS
ncbi:TIGR00341 family protein [Natronolimnohabitans sp. A-GB9]|uniref:TIGR00341 family protein n=1 Tax=Natronolimnohabitans sp. A-GB9 TaxID=3069757 RepID=UPI0027B5B428|nr:TIGR00341 family protein [Natronolimnohabitans sp. A-GB9]MDQ2049697.1 TIGR00341 family protein [Natronolimnohabitans sp. A-GB9]